MPIPEDPPPGIPEWVLTFGDMMSLLLTFFILLVSMSEMKKDDKFQGVADSMQEQFGFETATPDAPGESQPRNSMMASMAIAGRSKRNNVNESGVKVKSVQGEEPRVRMIRPGDRTTIGTVIFFANEEIELNEKQQEELRSIGDKLSGKPQKIEVRGHTSRKPISDASEIQDHLDLAYQRARKTMAFLVDDLKIDPQRIRITVAGANEPLNDSPELDKLDENSRVEVFLLEEIVDVN